MTVPFYGHVKQYHNIKSEIDANIHEVLESGQYVMGPMLKRFEKEFADYHGMKYAIGVGNGTDALWLSFMALGIGPGDECITHPNTFFATAEAIWIAGATAVFVDSDPKTNCIDPSKIEAAITPKTKAIVPVHLYGQCADMKAIRKIADKHKLFVIEDNAQAIGARGDGFKIGELSDAVCTSFIIQKNLGTFGDGGAVVTNNDQIDRHVRRLRNHGSEKRSCHSYGFNSRLDDIHAAVLSAKLKHIDDRQRSAPQACRALHRVLERRAKHHAAVREPRLPPRLSSLRDRDQASRASPSPARFPGQERHRCQVPLRHRHPSAGRLPVGQGRPHRGFDRQRGTQRRLAASRCRCSPNSPLRRSTTPSPRLSSGTGRWDKRERQIPRRRRRHGQAGHAPCLGISGQQPF